MCFHCVAWSASSILSNDAKLKAAYSMNLFLFILVFFPAPLMCNDNCLILGFQHAIRVIMLLRLFFVSFNRILSGFSCGKNYSTTAFVVAPAITFSYLFYFSLSMLSGSVGTYPYFYLFIILGRH